MIFTANTSQINKACSNVMRAVSVNPDDRRHFAADRRQLFKSDRL